MNNGRENYGEIYKNKISRQKNTQSVKKETTDGVQNILSNKDIEEIKDLAINFIKAKNYNGIINLIDSNFDIENGNIIVNHGEKYRGIDGKMHYSMLVNLNNSKELNFKKIYFLMINIFGGKTNILNDILSEFIIDEQLKNIILNGNFEIRNHGFKLIKKETN